MIDFGLANAAATSANESEITPGSTTIFDALNRVVASRAPDGSVTHPTYNEVNLLEQLAVNLRGSATVTPFVANIDHNVKGQRELIEYGNRSSTAYA